MPFTGIYGPEELAMLSEALDDHCTSHGIERAGPGYEDASYLVLELFKNGARTIEELKAALNVTLGGEVRRHA